MPMLNYLILGPTVTVRKSGYVNFFFSTRLRAFIACSILPYRWICPLPKCWIMLIDIFSWIPENWPKPRQHQNNSNSSSNHDIFLSSNISILWIHTINRESGLSWPCPHFIQLNQRYSHLQLIRPLSLMSSSEEQLRTLLKSDCPVSLSIGPAGTGRSSSFFPGRDLHSRFSNHVLSWTTKRRSWSKRIGAFHALLSFLVVSALGIHTASFGLIGVFDL